MEVDSAVLPAILKVNFSTENMYTDTQNDPACDVSK